MSAHQRSDTTFSPMFGRHLLQGPLVVALIVVIALFLGHRVVLSIFAVSSSNATQALLAANPNETTPKVYTDNGEATAQNARAAVEAYLGFLADGDAESATQMAGPKLESNEGLFLSENVFSQAVEHISQPVVTKVEEQLEGRFDVHVSYTLAGDEHRAVLQLHRRAARWVFEPMIRRLPIEPTPGVAHLGFSIAGVNASERNDDASYYRHFYVYPAVYQLDPPVGGYFDGDPVNVVASVEGDLVSGRKFTDPTVDYSSSFSDKALEFVQAEIRRALDECVTSPSRMFGRTHADHSFDCGHVALEYYSKVSNLEVEVVSYPSVDLTIGAPDYEVSGGLLKLSFTAFDQRFNSREPVQVADLEVGLSPHQIRITVADGELEVRGL